MADASIGQEHTVHCTGVDSLPGNERPLMGDIKGPLIGELTWFPGTELRLILGWAALWRGLCGTMQRIRMPFHNAWQLLGRPYASLLRLPEVQERQRI